MSPNCYPYVTTGSPNPWACPPGYPDGTGMGAALQLLLGLQLQPLLNLSACAFLTRGFTAGAQLTSPTAGTAAYDNLSAALTGVFSGFGPSGSGHAEITAPLYYPCGSVRAVSAAESAAAAPEPASAGGSPSQTQKAVGFAASEVRLEALDAVAVTAASGSYQSAKQLLISLLNPNPWYPPAPEPRCPGVNPGALPGGAGMPGPVVPSASARAVSLTAGALMLGGAAPLGALGEIRFFANDTASRFYLVRSDRIEFLA